MQNLECKTAFVTGGASGIGLGIAKALLGAGMNVVIADIRQDHLDEASAELGSAAKVLAVMAQIQISIFQAQGFISILILVHQKW